MSCRALVGIWSGPGAFLGLDEVMMSMRSLFVKGGSVDGGGCLR